MIEFQNVTKYYLTPSGRHYILRNVSFELPKNVNVGLLGRNGAGKSTMMRLIGGAEAPNEGEIIKNCSVSWPLGLAGGFQGSMTGLENVRFICRIYGLAKEQTREVEEFVTDFSEIGKFMKMPVKTYSSGMKARVTFGLSLALKFDVYLVDELTAVGDAQFRKKSEAAFDELRARATLIFVSHNLKIVEKVCDTVAVLHKGEFHYFENVAEGLANYKHWTDNDSVPPLKRLSPDEIAAKKAPAKKTPAKKAPAKKAPGQ